MITQIGVVSEPCVGMVTWGMVCYMDITPVRAPRTPAAPAAPPVGGEMTVHDRLRANLARHAKPLTPKEEKCAELFVLYRNKVKAYREAYEVSTIGRSTDYNNACNVIDRPHVLAYIDVLLSANAQAVNIDVSALLAADLAIVEAARHAGNITSHVWHCCRWCYGIDHKYQWRDENEYATALASWMDASALNAAREIKQTPEPTDDGGYGFVPQQEPAITCPHCEGMGEQKTIIHDTSKLGPAAPLYKGMKVTKNGIEVMLHDVDKAKERLYRATGSFGDDAASVARGAAAGAAVGAAAAAALAGKVEHMSADDARKAYLTLINP